MRGTIIFRSIQEIIFHEFDHDLRRLIFKDQQDDSEMFSSTSTLSYINAETYPVPHAEVTIQILTQSHDNTMLCSTVSESSPAAQYI